MRALFCAVALLAACGNELQKAGGICASSEECAAGLLCDFGQTPHVCAGMLSVSSDFSAALDAGAVDGATD